MTPTDTKDIILPDVSAEIREVFAKQAAKERETKSNYASRLGHPCTRNLVYWRTHWNHAEPGNATREMIFNGGKVIEKYIAKDYLERAGYTIVEQDRPVAVEESGMFKRLNIGGYLDFLARKGDEHGAFTFPIEAKSMSPYVWEKINSVEDFLGSRHVWHKAYPAQLTLYMLAKSYRYGMFLMINKLTFEPKHIWIDLDYTYAEEIVKKAEEINKHVAGGTLPDRIDYDESICGSCPFAHVCLKDIVRTETDVLTDPELINMLERRDALKPASKEYSDLDEEVKAKLKGVKKGIAGAFMVLGEKVKREGYEVGPKEYWQTNIKRL